MATVYRDMQSVERRRVREESGGKYQDHCKPFKDFRTNAESRKMPLERMREGLKK